VIGENCITVNQEQMREIVTCWIQEHGHDIGHSRVIAVSQVERASSFRIHLAEPLIQATPPKGAKK
jgi:hypothetical protein